MKVNKKAFGKALGLVCLSWLALPILYVMFCKKEVKEEDDRHTDKLGDNGDSDIHSDESRSDK